MIIINGLRQMCAWLCQYLYSFIASLYELFMNLSRVELLTSDDIQPIYQRVTMILAIIMVFYVTFEFVKYVIQPEAMTDKEKGAPKIVQKMIIVVALIAFVPTIFSTAYRLQNSIIGNQVFSKVILGKQDVNSEVFGRNFSANLFRMFYTVNEDIDNLGTCEDIPCEELVSMNINNLATQGKMPHITLGIAETEKVDVEVTSGKEKVEEYKIDFNPILAVGVGVFVVYMLVLYCIDVGVRVAQLAYLQIIAPIPIIGYLSPKKDGIFQKWTKQCITTYLDLFIRIAIIYFVLLFCEILGKAFSDGTLLENMGETSPMMKTFIYIALIMGLLMFAKKAPKMIGELFPSMGSASGNFGLKAKDRGLNLPGIFGAASGAAIGAGVGLATGIGQGWRRRNSLGADGKPKGIRAGIIGAATGAISGTIAGTGRGLMNGSKAKKGSMMKNVTAGAKNQVKANQRFGNRAESGYTFKEQMEDRVRGTFGAKSRIEVLEEQKAPIKRQKDAYTSLSSKNDKLREYALKKARDNKSIYLGDLIASEGRLKRLQEDKELIDSLGGENSESYKQAIRSASADIKKYKDLAINDFIDNNKDKDGSLINLLAARNSDLENYNKYASDGTKIPTRAVFEYETTDANGQKHNVTVDKEISELTAEEYDEYIKKVVKGAEASIEMKISEIDTDIEAIKRQQAGSGIGEKK